MNRNNNWTKILSIALYLFTVLVLSFAVFKVFMLIHEPHFKSFPRVAYGVLEGKPYWITYQNRLLGPYIVYQISRFGLTYLNALEVFTLITIVFQNFLMFFLLNGFTSKRNSFVLVAIYSLAFILIQERWFYTWDSIDVIIFSLFAYGINRSKTLLYFITLFFVGLVNKESAIFISFYILVDSFDFSKKSPRLVSKINLVAGFFLSLAAIFYTRFVRYSLYDSQPENTLSPSLMFLGNHLTLGKNLKYIFSSSLFSLDIIYAALVFGIVGYALYHLRSFTTPQIKTAIVILAIMANIIVFGIVNEARMYLIVFPLLIFHQVSLMQNRENVPQQD